MGTTFFQLKWSWPGSNYREEHFPGTIFSNIHKLIHTPFLDISDINFDTGKWFDHTHIDKS